MQTFWQDLRYGARILLKYPGFTLIAVMTLALGIGANTAIFSVINAVLLRALPFHEPERIVSVNQVSTGGLPGIPAYEYLEWREQNEVCEQIAAYSDNNYNLTGQGEPERISCAEVTASLFPLLGVHPLLGRVFSSDEDRLGYDQVVVVSEGFWQRRYGGDPSLIGKSITLNDRSYTVIGVMPASFRFPGDFEIWKPFALSAEKERQGDVFTLVQVIARLKPGMMIDRAATNLNVISRRTAEQIKDRMPDSVVGLVPLHRELVAGVRTTVLVLFGAVGFVLLIACANVASLMLSRASARKKEMALRAAVGAGRWRLVRQLLAESLLLGLAGGIFGILLAVWGIDPIVTLIPDGFFSSVQNLEAISIDRQVLGFTLLVSVLTGILFGLAPALAVSKPDLVEALKEGGLNNMTGSGWRFLRSGLVVAEIALALVLLLGAGLMIRSFTRLLEINPGFKAENVLTMRINLPRSKYKEPYQTAAFYQQLLERVAALPGARSTGGISHTPLSGFGMIAFIQLEGVPPLDRKKDRPIGIGVVTADYFQTMSIPLMSGRGFDARDHADTQQVAIINQALARRFWPNEDPVGKRISFGCEEGLCRTIVGVVGDIRQERLTQEATPEIYIPFHQSPSNGMTLLMRTEGDPLSFVSSVRSEVLAVDKDQPVHSVMTMQQRLDEAVATTRSLTILFGVFAALALVLAAVGVYGVISYSVSQRTREIGIRAALGAQPRDVFRLVISQGMKLAILGVMIGLGVAFGLTRLMTTLLFGVSATDPLTFVVIAAVLTLVALLACWIPARRATRVDPMVALRYE
jgi:putative ABC transport system permease protein